LVRGSYGGFQVRSHDIGDPADLGHLPEFIDGKPPLTPTLAQSFESYIEADLVAVLETIDNCLGRCSHPDVHALEHMGVGTLLQRRA